MEGGFCVYNRMLEERYFAKGNEPQFKIIMVGESGVGKTTLFWKYLEGEFLQHKPETVTIIDFKIREVEIGGRAIKLYIWDTAGQERYRSMVASYFHGCQGVMLVFDLSSRASFLSASEKWYPLSRARCPQALTLLVGNKCDLPQAVPDEEVTVWAGKSGVRFIKTSVKDDINVEQAYRTLSEAIFQKLDAPKNDSFALRKGKLPSGQKQGCC
jgi:small GTP-binding protein